MQNTVRAQRSFWFRGALLLFAALVVLVSWLGSADRASANYLDGALLQASVAFASARVLNALVSVLQSTTLSFSLFGGVAVTLGELLDPFNDLIEQYGTLMQWAIGSLLTQKILLGVVSHGLFKVLISISAALLALSLWWRQGRWAARCLRLFLVLLFLRFALAAVVLLNGAVDHHFLDDQTRQQMARLDNLPGQVELLRDGDSVFEAEPALNALAERERTLQNQLSQLQAEQQQLDRALTQSRRALAAKEEHMSSLQKLNPFTRDNDHAALAQQVELLARQRQQNTEHQRQLQQRLAGLERERSAVQRAKSANHEQAEGWSVLREQLAQAGDPQTYHAIRQALDNAVDTVLRAMTLFFLRTLVLPLLFLYLLLKGVRAIWRLDLQSWLSRERAPSQPLAT
ncbi:MAG: hypothetical protein V7756_12785 [Halopseudomonas sp.]|uniref:hypothetical protein n=1 Tax=Halopseudomonas sp. TaxID=2901191 RepID=UPI003002A71D